MCVYIYLSGENGGRLSRLWDFVRWVLEQKKSKIQLMRGPTIEPK